MKPMQSNRSLSEYQVRELERIDREIQEYLLYLERLHEKNVQKSHISKLAKKNRKKGKVNPSNSLSRFSQKKLKEFERQKEFILRQRQVVEVIEWDCVRFEDHSIRVSAHGYLSEPFSLPESRKSLEFLKSYINRSTLKPLRITLLGNKIVSIENADELRKIVEILSLQNEINYYFEDARTSTFENIYSKLGKISNKHLVDLFKIREKGTYIHYLCQVQSPNYKIIPTTEIIGTGQGMTSWEETFLFTATKNKVPYIIWESTAINRATYIFKASDDTYYQDVQRIFDFIASEQERKRSKLRQSIGNSPLKNIGVAQHEGLKSWIAKINSIVKQ